MPNKQKLLSVNQAIEKITKKFSSLDDEDVELTSALGRVTAKPIKAKINNPPQDVSSMDGYAISSKTISNHYKIIGESSAGNSFDQKVKEGETVQIFTGANIPKGTDTVVIQENVSLKNKNISIKNLQKLRQNQNIRPKGLNFEKGTTILNKNSIINSRNIGSIAMSGNFWINVIRKPIVGILSTGNELEKVGQLNIENKIPSGNNIMLASMVKIFGGISRILPIAEDKEETIKKIIEKNLDCNLLLTTGGASVGKYDLLYKIFKSKNNKTKINFWKIAMRPGKPLIFCLYDNTPILSLPGNPVSAGVCSLIFLRAAINKMLGLNNFFPEISNGIICHSLQKNNERMDFLRAKSEEKDGKSFITVFEKQDSSMINLFALSNCLLIRNPFEKKLKAGDPVKIIKYSSYF